MNYFRRIFSGLDPYLMGAVFVLLGFSVIALISSNQTRGMHDELTQFGAIAIGLVLLVALALAHPKTVHRSRYAVALIAFALMSALPIFGRVVNGSRSWFFIGPFSFQPIEFAKVALVIILASILPLHARARSLRAVISASIVTAIFSVLILLQPDLGSAMIIIGLWCAMLLVSGVPRRYIVVLFFAAIAIGALAWQFVLHDYQKARVLIFLDPSRDPLGRGYNVTQAQIAVGSGGFLGAGFASGTQSQLRFLPESQTDFVFSLLAEELGFLAVTLLIAALMVVVWRLYRLARRAPDDFSQFLAIGAATLLTTETFVAVGGNIGLLPMTGITLPFVSAGGSSMVAHLALIGLAQGVSRAASRNVNVHEGRT